MTFEEFKAKDIFNILAVCKNKELIKYIIPKIELICNTFIPEEIVILNNLIA